MSNQFQHPFQESQFDLFEWYPRFLSCCRFFLDHGQYTSQVQAVASLVNIQLPFENQSPSSSSRLPSAQPAASVSLSKEKYAHVAVVPYIRRLVVTGYDTATILHGFFGDDWSDGVGVIREMERRNYLFAAKSDTWLKVKASYDIENGQVVPFLRPLQEVDDTELADAETDWSNWLAMQDWMLGAKAPFGGNESSLSP